MVAQLTACDFYTRLWLEAGLQRKPLSLLHSNSQRLLRHMHKAFGLMAPQILVDSLVQACGTSTTLLLPAFQFQWPGQPFDRATTPSEMGTLTTAALKDSRFVRTGHPFYSFLVYSPKPAYREKARSCLNPSGYGLASPFSWLTMDDGQILILNLPDQHSMTFYHHVEELAQAPYRQHKAFTGLYRDYGATDYEAKTFSLYVRDLAQGVVTHVQPMQDYLTQQGHYAVFTRDSLEVRRIEARLVYRETYDVIQQGVANQYLYAIDPKVKEA